MSSFLSSNNFLRLSRLSCARLPLIIAYRPQSSPFYRKQCSSVFFFFFFFLPQLSCMQIANGAVGICSLHGTYFFIISDYRTVYVPNFCTGSRSVDSITVYYHNDIDMYLVF